MKLFLWGIALQAGLAALNKLLMWTLYYGEIKPSYKLKKRYKATEWISDQIWIDVLVDLVTVALFAVATERLAKVVLS